jgi:hypothetical protein
VVYFPEEAPWLGELMAELLGFPGVRHDDQVDSISQALAFISWRESHRSSCEPLRIRRADYDTQHTGVLKLDSNWNIIASIGFGQPGDPVFNAVHDLALGRDGSIYIAETRTKRVVKLRPR